MEIPRVLKQFADLADSLNLFYWINAGSLLGLMRNGKLLPWDNDIDIAVLENQQEQLEMLIETYRKKGCKVRVVKNKGVIYKIKISIVDTDYSSLKSIDIDVFMKKGRYVWARQFWYCLINIDKQRHDFKSKLLKILPYLIIKKFVRNNNADIASFLYRKTFKFIVWAYPATLLEKFVYMDEVRVPEEWEKILEYTYGDWRTPQENWDYLKDDKSLIFCSPDEFQS